MTSFTMSPYSVIFRRLMQSNAALKSRTFERFEELPAELRRQIYQEAISQERSTIRISDPSWRPPSLSAVSREARTECLPLYYTNRHVSFDLCKLYIKLIPFLPELLNLNGFPYNGDYRDEQPVEERWAATLDDRSATCITKLSFTIEGPTDRVGDTFVYLQLRGQGTCDVYCHESGWRFARPTDCCSIEELRLRSHLGYYFRRLFERLYNEEKGRPVLTAMAMQEVLAHLRAVLETYPMALAQENKLCCLERDCWACSGQPWAAR